MSTRSEKTSTPSTSNKSQRKKPAREYMSNKRQCLETEEGKLNVLHEGLREAFEQGKLEPDKFKRLVQQLFENKAKITQEYIRVKRNEDRMADRLAQEDIDNEPDMTAAYANLLSLVGSIKSPQPLMK